MVRILAILLLLHTAALAGGGFTDEMYRRALGDQSTAELYVLITLRDAKTGSERVVCVPAPALLGAIAREYHLDYDDAGSREQLRIALEQPGRKFSFSNPKALRNVEPDYTPAVLAKVRPLLEGKSRSELLKQAEASDSELQRIYSSKTDVEEWAAYRDAIAHVLLEHGIQAGIGDITGGLFVAK